MKATSGMFDRLPLHVVAGAISLLFVGGTLAIEASAANPSNKDFDAGFAVHGKELAGELAKRAQALYEESNAATIKFGEAVKNNKVTRLSWKPLGENEVRLDQLRRLAEQLDILGETAGVDYRMRADALFRTTSDIIDAFRGNPVTARQMDKVRVALKKQEPARAREIEKLTKMAREGKWEATEAALYKYLDQLGVATACLSNPEKIQIYTPFGEVRGAVDQAMRQARTSQAKNLITARRQAEAPDFAGVLQDIRAAAESLASAGTATVDGVAMSGPESVTVFGTRWAEAQVKTIRCRTLDWLLANSMEMYDGTQETPGTSNIVTEFGQFNRAMQEGLANLIDADAQRVSGADAVSLYVDYLRAFAPLVRRSANQGLAPAIAPALQRLAGKAPQFPAEVAAYAQATDDLLRWRARVARNRAVAHADRYPAIDRLMFDATTSREDYVGLYPVQRSTVNAATLLASAPEVMARPLEELPGKQAHALDIVRLGGNGPVAIARYRLRSYVNVPAPLDLAAETDALKFDLMVSESLPPLSLLAAVAVDSAERGDLAAVGGTIANQYLESLATRFAALPTAASVLTPLGAVPPEQAGTGYRSQVLMRFDLEPTWAQHDFFFANLASAATPAE